MYVRMRGEKTYLLRWELPRDGSGKRSRVHETFHGSRREAERYWAKKETEVRRQGYREPSRESLASYLDAWVERTDVRPSTRASYRRCVRLYIRPHLGLLSVGEITPAHVQRWLSSLTVGPRTAAIARGVLHAAMEDAVRLGLAPANPATPVRGPRQTPRRTGSFSVEQVETLIAEAYRTTRMGPLFEFLWLSGLRPSEALGLRWSDVDGDTVRVRRARVEVEGRMVEQETPKTRSGIRDIVLPQQAVEALERQREMRHAEGWSGTPSDLIFTASNGNGIFTGNASRTFRRIAERLGLPPYRLYGLRHTAASHQLAAGVPLHVVSKRLGHRNISHTADIYGHLLPEEQRDAARKMDEYAKRQQSGNIGNRP